MRAKKFLNAEQIALHARDVLDLEETPSANTVENWFRYGREIKADDGTKTRDCLPWIRQNGVRVASVEDVDNFLLATHEKKRIRVICARRAATAPLPPLAPPPPPAPPLPDGWGDRAVAGLVGYAVENGWTPEQAEKLLAEREGER